VPLLLLLLLLLLLVLGTMLLRLGHVLLQPGSGR
jgi:hypothetical protein